MIFCSELPSSIKRKRNEAMPFWHRLAFYAPFKNIFLTSSGYTVPVTVSTVTPGVVVIAPVAGSCV